MSIKPDANKLSIYRKSEICHIERPHKVQMTSRCWHLSQMNHFVEPDQSHVNVDIAD